MSKTKKKQHGGKRKGAGRPLKHGEPTMVISFRVPASKVSYMKTLFNSHLKNL